MVYRSLGEYLEDLVQPEDLRHVSVEVDPVLEIAEITDRMVKSGGPALLFGRVQRYHMAVATNLFGSEKRICRALGVESLDHWRERLVALADGHWEHRWIDRLSGNVNERSAARFRPQRVKTAACQQVVKLGEDIDLRTLPALKSWPDESVAVITSAQLVSQDSQTGIQTIDRVLLPILDRHTLALQWDPTGRGHVAGPATQPLGEKLPVAVVLGGDPVFMMMAELPWPPSVDFLTIVGAMRNAPLDVVSCRTHDLWVPAEAEIVIEALLDPVKTAIADPPRTAAPNGFYCQPGQLHRLEVTAVTHRVNPVFPATVLGPPPTERATIQSLVERMVLTLVQQVVPEVVKISLPPYSPQQEFAVVAIRKKDPFQGRQVANALWGFPATMRTKTVIVVDDHVDVYNAEEVLFQVGAHVALGRDLFFQDGSLHPYDHSAAFAAGTILASGRKMGVDATTKYPGECVGECPLPTIQSREVRELVCRRWEDYGFMPAKGEVS